MEGYLETLSGYINDEDKIVTYKWLSKELEVHVNVAKKILEEFWNKYKLNSNDSMVATIMLIGYIKDEGMRVEIVKEENLTTAKEKYNRLISEHIYSLQKSLTDIQLLAETEKGDTTYGAIKCEKSNLRSDEELFAKRWGLNAKFDAATIQKTESSLEKRVENKPKGLLDNHLKLIKISSSNGSEKNKAEETVTSKSANDDMKSTVEEKVTRKTSNNNAADKAVTKKVSPPKGKTADKKGGQSKKPMQSQATGFQNLFGKANTLNQNKSPPHKKEQLEEKENSLMKNTKLENGNSMDTNDIKIVDNKAHDSPEDMDIDIIQKEEKHVPLKEKEKINNGNSKTKINKKRGNKRQRSQESNKNDSKKRKRIIMPDDSSEESADSEAEPDVFDDSPPKESTQPTKERSPSPRIQQINGKRKVRKAVDKTYQDEDGFLVTKKEYIYESASDEEIPNVKEVQEIKRTVSDPKPLDRTKSSNKQTTLMSFFKKA